MTDSYWDKLVGVFAKIRMRPILFNDLTVTFIEVIGACHPVDWVTTEHRHPWYEFNYLSDGAVYTSMEDTEFLAGAGTFFLIPPGVRHSHRHYEHTGDDGFCVRWRLEKNAVSVPSAQELIADRIIAGLSCFQPRSIAYPADSLFSGMENSPAYVMEAAMLKWMMDVYSVLNPHTAQDEIDTDLHQQKSIVTQVLLYLNAYSTTDFNVSELADSIGYSYRHLSRIFKEKTGSTIIEKLNSIRIAKAISLLESTDMPISAICGEVGFQTETYFYTLFSQHTHMSPAQFRRAHRKG